MNLKAFALTGRLCYIYLKTQGDCPGLGAFGLSARLRLPLFRLMTHSFVLSHAARYSERSSDSGQYADGYLKNCFPSVRFHFF